MNPTTPTAYARTMTGGKRDSKCEARITDDVKFDLQRRCHELGMTESDFVGRLIEVSLYGFDHVLKLERDRIGKVCGLSGFAQGKTT